MAWFRTAAASVWVLAAAGCVGVVVVVDDPYRLARGLGDLGGVEYALWIGWLLLAPVVLAAAYLLGRRTPWSWVAVCALHVTVLATAVARLAHLAPWWLWAYLAAVVVTGVASIVTASAGRRQA